MSEHKKIEPSEIVLIDKAIEGERDDTKRNLLRDFKNQYESALIITVKGFDDYWEIIVEHPDTANGYTGGTECYHLNKISGESEMIWHEHPMEIEESAPEDNL